ncbi:MAG: hypothetical protein GXY22_05030 [Clostridiaceae bacterium]|jgi:hypothetical protein|nr:hypothetical protein [Eubacteriales bacterium]NLV47999.1 hypothetical protein [Clostridiaceae bacterium]
MKTYDELIEIARKHRETLVLSIRKAHEASLRSENPEDRCSVIAINRQDGSLTDAVIDSDQQPDNWFVLAAYPHINPIEAVVLYADEKAAILNNWCLEQGAAPPDQDDEEGDVPYLRRLVSWIENHMGTTAGEVLTDLAREQLITDFDPVSELDDALQSLRDLSNGIVRAEPSDDE